MDLSNRPIKVVVADDSPTALRSRLQILDSRVSSTSSARPPTERNFCARLKILVPT